MIPFRTGNRVAFQKDQSQILLSTRTDVDRLWRIQGQQTDGNVIGGQNPYGTTFTPTFTIDEYEGQLTSAIAAPGTDGWTTPTTGTALQYIVDPTSVASPIGMIAGSTSFTLINRDLSLSGSSGDYARWKKITLSDGTTEYRVTWIQCP